MWALVVVLSSTMSLTINNFELQDHCKTAIEQIKPLEGKAACIWIPKGAGLPTTTSNNLIIAR
jgi:hypothetical protein